jgi:hypothetical protein
MQVERITNSIRANLRERGRTSRFTDEALVDYINDVSLEVSDYLQFGRKVVEITPNDDKVYLPADCLRIERVAINYTELSPLSPREAQLSDGSGLGGVYGYIFHDNYLQIIPNSDSNVTLSYKAGIPRIDNIDQDLTIDEAYRMPLVFGVSARCFVELGDFQRAQYFEGKYEAEKRARRAQLRQKAFRNRKGPFVQGLEL